MIISGIRIVGQHIVFSCLEVLPGYCRVGIYLRGQQFYRKFHYPAVTFFREYLDVNLFFVFFPLHVCFGGGDDQFVFRQFHAPCLVFDGGCFHVGLFYHELLLLSQTESGCAFILDCQVEVFSVDGDFYLAVVGTDGKGDLPGRFVDGHVAEQGTCVGNGLRSVGNLVVAQFVPGASVVNRDQPETVCIYFQFRGDACCSRFGDGAYRFVVNEQFGGHVVDGICPVT